MWNNIKYYATCQCWKEDPETLDERVHLLKPKSDPSTTTDTIPVYSSQPAPVLSTSDQTRILLPSESTHIVVEEQPPIPVTPTVSLPSHLSPVQSHSQPQEKVPITSVPPTAGISSHSANSQPETNASTATVQSHALVAPGNSIASTMIPESEVENVAKISVTESIQRASEELRKYARRTSEELERYAAEHNKPHNENTPLLPKSTPK